MLYNADVRGFYKLFHFYTCILKTVKDRLKWLTVTTSHQYRRQLDRGGIRRSLANDFSKDSHRENTYVRRK